MSAQLDRETVDPYPGSARHAAAGRGAGMARISGLDGLRAVAVTAVVVYHLGGDKLTGGFLGVDLFFVISGFLITSLLLAELERSGGIDLRRFYIRRTRRLLPALLLMLAGTALLAATVARDSISTYIRDLPGALFYVSNWWSIGHEQSYFELIGRGPLLGHLWSLAIEEQFYLVWPFVLVLVAAVARRRQIPVRNLVRWVAIGGALLSTLVMTSRSLNAGYPLDADPTRVYFGTDTHAMTVLVGAALATMWRPLTYRRNVVAGAVVFLGVVGGVALAASVWFFVNVTEYTPWLYRGGFLVAGLVFALLIATVSHPASPWTLMLDSPPFRWIGERSYGIYLWHWPIFLVTRPGIDVPWQSLAFDAVRVALVLLVAEASYRWVEVPIRQGALKRWWLTRRSGQAGPLPVRRLVTVGAFVSVLVLGVGTSFARPPAPAADQAALSIAIDDGEGTTTTASEPRETTRTRGTASPNEVSPKKETEASATRAFTGQDVAWFGDSVTAWSAEVLRQEVPGVSISAGNNRSPGLIQSKVRARLDDGTLRPIVVMHLGTAGPVSADSLGALLSDLDQEQRVVLINSTARFPWVKDSNKTLATLAGRYDNVVLADWKTYSRDHPEWFKDGLHLTPVGKPQFARFIRDAALKGLVGSST